MQDQPDGSARPALHLARLQVLMLRSNPHTFESFAMHQVRLSAQFRAALRQRRGREHVFRDIDAQHTALLVIDMQNAFVAPGAALEVPLARGIVANINRLAGAARAGRSPVYWVRVTFARAGRSAWSMYFDHFAPGGDPEAIRSSLYAGSEGHAFWPELDIRPGDCVVDKDRFSAFIQGASDLESRLRAAGTDTIVITGTVTNVCCESSARDAMMLGLRPIVVEDACAARTDEEHLAALENVARVFGDVVTTETMIARLQPQRPQ